MINFKRNPSMLESIRKKREKDLPLMLVQKPFFVVLDLPYKY